MFVCKYLLFHFTLKGNLTFPSFNVIKLFFNVKNLIFNEKI